MGSNEQGNYDSQLREKPFLVHQHLEVGLHFFECSAIADYHFHVVLFCINISLHLYFNCKQYYRLLIYLRIPIKILFFI